jgi:hypothetical protein
MAESADLDDVVANPPVGHVFRVRRSFVDRLIMADPVGHVSGELPPIVVELVVRRQLIQLFARQLDDQVVARNPVEQDAVELLQPIPPRLVGERVVPLLGEPEVLNLPGRLDLGSEYELPPAWSVIVPGSFESCWNRNGRTLGGAGRFVQHFGALPIRA